MAIGLFTVLELLEQVGKDYSHPSDKNTFYYLQITDEQRLGFFEENVYRTIELVMRNTELWIPNITNNPRFMELDMDAVSRGYRIMRKRPFAIVDPWIGEYPADSQRPLLN